MTREVQGFFEKLYFSESVLGDPHIDSTGLRIPVTGLFLLAGHPLQGEGNGPYKGELVFQEVLDSRRKVTEYIGDARKPKGFKAPHELVDKLAFNQSDNVEGFQEFCFEGYQESTNAWIDNWIVKAKSFRLRVF